MKLIKDSVRLENFLVDFGGFFQLIQFMIDAVETDLLGFGDTSFNEGCKPLIVDDRSQGDLDGLLILGRIQNVVVVSKLVFQ